MFVCYITSALVSTSLPSACTNYYRCLSTIKSYTNDMKKKNTTSNTTNNNNNKCNSYYCYYYKDGLTLQHFTYKGNKIYY